MGIALESYCMTEKNKIRLLGLLRNMCWLFRIEGKKYSWVTHEMTFAMFLFFFY